VTGTHIANPEGPFEPTWESLKQYEVPRWYLDGKFGIFIHWGVYAVPAFGSEWYPRNMYQQGSKAFEHHGEAIYDTRPWKVFGEGPTEVATGGFTDTKRGAFTSRDIRFTTRSDTLYAIILAWPEKGEAVIQSLSNSLRLYPEAVGSVQLLGATEPVKWSRGKTGLRVKLPAERPCETGCVLKIAPEH